MIQVCLIKNAEKQICVLSFSVDQPHKSFKSTPTQRYKTIRQETIKQGEI